MLGGSSDRVNLDVVFTYMYIPYTDIVIELGNIQEHLVSGALGHAESEFSTYLCAQTI